MHTEETSRVLVDGGVTQAVAHATVLLTKASKETATRLRVCASARYKQQAPVYIYIYNIQAPVYKSII